MMKFNRKLNRRDSLKLLLGSGGLRTLSMGAPVVVRKATAAESEKSPYPGSKKVRTICTHCSVGCGIIAEVYKGV